MRLIGNVVLGRDVSIGGPSEIMAKHSAIYIGDDCDIASYVTITTADSHKRCIGTAIDVERRAVIIEDHVFIGQGAIILGGTRIGHHSVIGAGVVLAGQDIPPYSRVRSPQPTIEPGFYWRDKRADDECSDDVRLGSFCVSAKNLDEIVLRHTRV